MQKYIKRYYNLKVFKGLDFEKRNKVQLLYKNILSGRPSKKLNYIKIGPFKVRRKITEINYKLNLLVKIKIYPGQHITILELVYREYKLLIYKADTYRRRKKDK